MTFKEYLEIQGKLIILSLGVENRHRSRITNLLILLCTFLTLSIISIFLFKSWFYLTISLLILTAIFLIWQSIRLFFWKKLMKKIAKEIGESYKNKENEESAYKIIQKYFYIK